MEIGGLWPHLSLTTALKEMGFKMNSVEKQGKKTVITISRYGQNGEEPDVLTAGGKKGANFNG